MWNGFHLTPPIVSPYICKQCWQVKRWKAKTRVEKVNQLKTEEDLYTEDTYMRNWFPINKHLPINSLLVSRVKSSYFQMVQSAVSNLSTRTGLIHSHVKLRRFILDGVKNFLQALIENFGKRYRNYAKIFFEVNCIGLIKHSVHG